MFSRIVYNGLPNHVILFRESVTTVVSSQCSFFVLRYTPDHQSHNMVYRGTSSMSGPFVSTSYFTSPPFHKRAGQDQLPSSFTVSPRHLTGPGSSSLSILGLLRTICSDETRGYRSTKVPDEHCRSPIRGCRRHTSSRRQPPFFDKCR